MSARAANPAAMTNDERNERVRVSRIVAVRSCCTCATAGLSPTSRLSNANREIGHLPVGRIHQHVADLPRQRHLLADRQLRIEHGRGACERGAITRGVEVRCERGGDGDEPEHETEMASADRQVRGDAGVAIGDRHCPEHIAREAEPGAEDGQSGREVTRAGRGQKCECHEASGHEDNATDERHRGCDRAADAPREKRRRGQRAHHERAGQGLVLPDLDDEQHTQEQRADRGRADEREGRGRPRSPAHRGHEWAARPLTWAGDGPTRQRAQAQRREPAGGRWRANRRAG